MPVLRGLMRKVKESNQADKAEYYKVQKELQSLEMQKRSLEHIVLSCRLRIEDLEKAFVGTVSKGTDSPAFLTASSLPQ
jgi:predicted  nucleic acid-binding Zn-ribbon protein